MPRDGSVTRARILDAAETLVFARGFAGAGVEQIISSAGLTKGAFFHHFATKQALADALIERWAAGDERQLNEKMAHAEALSRDPLQQLLIFVGLFAEEARELQEDGCLFGAFCYQEGLLDVATVKRIDAAMRLWRTRLRAKLDQVVARYPPRLPVDLDALADLVNVVAEGSFVMARSMDEPHMMADQMINLRNYLELLFAER